MQADALALAQAAVKPGMLRLAMPTLALVLLVAAVALLLLWTVLLRRDALVGRRTRAAASANLARRVKRWDASARDVKRGAALAAPLSVPRRRR
jgi:uncharacterized membrane protein